MTSVHSVNEQILYLKLNLCFINCNVTDIWRKRICNTTEDFQTISQDTSTLKEKEKRKNKHDTKRKTTQAAD